MYQEERIVKILEELSARGRLSNQEVCDLLDISRDTARRDIIKLVNEGSAVRTHGGIASTFYKQEVKKYKDRGFLNRKDHASQSKIAIAERANQMIHSKDMCFFDVSTTITFLSELVEEETIIFTHSLDNAGRLVEKDHVELHLLGGKFHKKNRFFYDLFHFNELIKDLHFDRVFIGAAGITEEGVYFADREDAL
ncbi:DeoR/GlpR family DNA-binding transcription regulator [Bacillus sp. JCM 19041]|uniref:DeoR/GlpR family DNA-binding transcription regulator n=1 Tax=Bacillus sp. JCM 19041 TaxID=1460637 RepID=UPI0006D08ED2